MFYRTCKLKKTKHFIVSGVCVYVCIRACARVCVCIDAALSWAKTP